MYANMFLLFLCSHQIFITSLILCALTGYLTAVQIESFCKKEMNPVASVEEDGDGGEDD